MTFGINKILPFLILVALFLNNSFAQNSSDNAVENLNSNQENSTNSNTEIFTEKIQKISPNRKVFILSNNNNQLDKGDFISFILEDNLVCRAIVAKNTEDKQAGIKIMKIYSLKFWNKLHEQKDVQIIRGDDSYYLKSKEKVVKKEDDDKKDSKSLIDSDDDLYNEVSIKDLDDLEENSKRAIKPDNIFGIAYGQILGVDASDASKYYPHYLAHWAFQFADNIWAEAVYGQTTISDFPNGGLDTKVTNYIGRIKYTFNAPFNSYLFPYAGYQYQNAYSPDAGKQNAEGTATNTELQNETKLVDKLGKNQMVVGVTILKRLVPGWFVKGNLGTDIMDIGFSLEF